MDTTVIVTLSDSRSGVVNHDLVLAEIIGWIGMRANCSVEIIELSEEKIVVSYEYDLSREFGIPAAEGEPYYGWTYTIERNPDDEYSGLHNILEVIYALCVVNREICSDEVARKVAESVENANVASVENLRDALRYYGSSACWDGDKLISPYRKAEAGGRPWDPAYNALMGRYVRPVKQVLSEMEKRRRNQPDFLKR